MLKRFDKNWNQNVDSRNYGSKHQMTNIIIADDHPLFRHALRTTVEPLFADHKIVEYETLAETHDALDARETSLLFLDLRMADSQGLSGLLLIKSTYPQTPVVVVSASEEANTVRAAIQAGAAGYIFKSFSLEQIKQAVETVLRGETFVPSSVSSAITEVEQTGLDNISRIATLTPAQLKVFRYMYDGMMNKQIAYEMSISEATVKAHVTTMFRKLGVRTRTQAVVMGADLDVEKQLS
jgi:DNA-binding NarL/FixJ family response regulator